MRPTHLLILLTITLTILLLYTSPTEAKRRPPGRKRHPPSTKVFPKKKARIFNPFLFRRNKAPGRRPKDFGGAQESKNVYYYSVPKVTQRPRIILGEELDFSSLGIHSNKPKPTGSLTSVQSALIEQELNEHDDLLPPSSYSSRRPHSRGPNNNRQPKRTRGPGYRLRENRPWKDHYVLEHENRRPPKSSHPQVMSSMMKAAGEIRNAYKAAVIQSAKVAKFTGHTVGKYFKGVRNIFGGSGYDNGRSDTPYRKSSEASDVKNGVLTSDGLLEIPTASNSAEQKPPRKSNEDLSTDSSSGVIPNVYLDWGGSFWKFFYNKSKGINGKGSSLSEIEHDQSKQI